MNIFNPESVGNTFLKKINLSVFIIMCLTLFFYNNSPGFSTNDILKGYKISRDELPGWIEEQVILDHMNEPDKWQRVSPESFSRLDMCEGYYKAGLSFYNGRKKMLALKTFMKGAGVLKKSPYKKDCLFYTARIFYQLNNRESALYYINRTLEAGKTNSRFTEDAEKLKRRIRWEYISHYEGLPDDSISAIEFDGDDLWIGMWTGGAGRFTRSSHKLTLFKAGKNSLISPHVRCIEIDKNRVWIGTYNGLCCFDKKTEKWSREKGDLGYVTIKRIRILGGRLYAATLGKGLFVFDENSGKWRKEFQKALQITDILFEKGRLYIASLDKGVFINNDGKYQNFLGDIPVKSLCLYNSLLWIGTHGSGVYIMDSKDRIIKHFTSGNGMVSDYIESVRVMKNSMFIGTLGGGVMSYHFKSRQWSSMNVLTGLPSNDVVNINFEKNRIWFGTLSGGIGILVSENFEDI